MRIKCITDVNQYAACESVRIKCIIDVNQYAVCPQYPSCLERLCGKVMVQETEKDCTPK